MYFSPFSFSPGRKGKTGFFSFLLISAKPRRLDRQLAWAAAAHSLCWSTGFNFSLSSKVTARLRRSVVSLLRAHEPARVRTRESQMRFFNLLSVAPSSLAFPIR
jgi:hypothetical protein